MSISAMLRSAPLIRAFFMPLILVRRAFVSDRRIPLLHKMMSHVKSGMVLIEMPDFHGDFALNVHSHLAYRVMLYGRYEPEYAEICRRECKPNRDAIDVGANVGFYSVLLGKTVATNRRVLSIEPTHGAFAYLCANIERNGLTGKVLAEQIIASDTDVPRSLTVFVGHEEYSSIGEFDNLNAPDAERQIVETKARTIDALCEEHNLEPGFIKIDVEGFEHHVLQGAMTILRNQGSNIPCVKTKYGTLD